MLVKENAQVPGLDTTKPPRYSLSPCSFRTSHGLSTHLLLWFSWTHGDLTYRMKLCDSMGVSSREWNVSKSEGCDSTWHLLKENHFLILSDMKYLFLFSLTVKQTLCKWDGFNPLFNTTPSKRQVQGRRNLGLHVIALVDWSISYHIPLDACERKMVWVDPCYFLVFFITYIPTW